MNASIELTQSVYQNVRKAIVGALKDQIKQHGKVTETNFSSAEKRVIGMVWGTLHNEAERQAESTTRAPQP